MSWEKLSASKVHGGMGFKDLTAFNLAMLGKKGLKLFTEPDSHAACIFKASYFPSGTYLTAQLGGTWWSIGSGVSNSIFNESWLPNGECIDGDISGAHFF